MEQDPYDKRIVDFPFTICNLPKSDPIVVLVLKKRPHRDHGFELVHYDFAQGIFELRGCQTGRFKCDKPNVEEVERKPRSL